LILSALAVEGRIREKRQTTMSTLRTSDQWRKRLRRLMRCLRACMLVFLTPMIQKVLMWRTECGSPVLVSLSGVPRRGDVLFLTNVTFQLNAGDTIAFRLKHRSIPSVHRIIEKVYRDGPSPNNTREPYFLTKGDDNRVDDRNMYGHGKLWLKREDVVGKVHGVLPHVGMIYIMLDEYPMIRYLILGTVAIVMLRDKKSLKPSVAFLLGLFVVPSIPGSYS